MSASVRALARALGGDVVRDGIVFPGPGHSRTDRSASFRLDPRAPDGFVVNSFAGDDPLALRDHVRPFLDIAPFRPGRRKADPVPRPARTSSPDPVPDDCDRIERARTLWRACQDPRGTIVERYLASRRLDLSDDVAGHVIRFHPACPWKDEETGRGITVPAMVAVMRDVITDEITAVHRTRLTQDGRKVGRRMLGRASGAAVKIDADEAVSMGLVVGEGIETCLAARQLGLRPVWALGSAGSIAKLPVLSGVDALTILAERQDDGTPNRASDRAVSECGARWNAADREVVVIDPPAGDVSSTLTHGAAQ